MDCRREGFPARPRYVGPGGGRFGGRRGGLLRRRVRRVGAPRRAFAARGASQDVFGAERPGPAPAASQAPRDPTTEGVQALSISPRPRAKGKAKAKDAHAKAARDASVHAAYLARACSTGKQSEDASFPRNWVGLDSWANIWLRHERVKESTIQNYEEDLGLAYGTIEVKGRRDVGFKGVPRMFLPWLPEGENIDLVPEGFILERGCSLVKGDVNEITTPTGRVITIRWWGMLPCLTKSEWQQILDDLPPPETPGRSGWAADPPRVAPVSYTHLTLPTKA